MTPMPENKRNKIPSEFVTNSQPVQGILTGLHQRLDATTSQTMHYYEQPSVLVEPSDNPTCEGTNKPTYISTDADYFNKMDTTQRNNNHPNENIHDDISDSDSNDSGDTQPDSSTDEDIEDIDEVILEGQLLQFWNIFLKHILYVVYTILTLIF